MLTDVKSTLRVGVALFPLIFMSDGTHFSNSAGDNKEWLVYITIGNLSSKICQMLSTDSVPMVALLPIPIKYRKILQKVQDEQQQTNREVVNNVLWRVLQVLTFNQNPNAESGYYNVLCADCNLRRRKSVLTAWLPDCPQYRDLYHLERHVCFWCECPKTTLGDYVPTDNLHPRRDHNLDRTLSDANTMTAYAKRSSRHDHGGFNSFRQIPSIVSDLQQPDLLHTMQIGMLDHLHKWMFTWWRGTNGLTSTMRYGYPSLPTMTSHQKLSHMRKFLNGMGRRWRKWAGTCLEL